MAKIDPRSLTLDFKSLMSLNIHQRYQMGQDPRAQSYLASLTPTEYAMLFPSYYRQRLSSMGVGPQGAPGAAPSGTQTGGPATAPAPGPGGDKPTLSRPSSGPASSTEMKPAWLQALEKETGSPLAGSQASPRSNIAPAVGSLASIRANQMKELEDPKVRAAVIARAEIEVGSQPQAQQAWLESVFNRAAANRLSLYDAVSNTPKHRYYPGKDDSRWKNLSGNVSDNLDKKFAGHLSAVGGGANTIDYATDNASGTLGEKKQREFGGKWVGGEQFTSDPGTRRNWANNQRKIDEELRARGLLGQAATAQPGDPSQTGSTAIVGLKSQERRSISTDPKELERLNKERKDYYGGTLRLEGQEYRFGTGGRKAGSVPFGPHDITGLRSWSNYPQFVNNSFEVKNMFDPKLGRMREGILIHSQTELDKLYSAGCIAISREQWPKFKEHLLDYMKRTKGPITMTINPDGNAYIGPKGSEPTASVAEVTNDLPKMPRNVDPKEAMELRKRLPANLHPDIVKYYDEKMDIDQRKDFIERLEKNPKLLDVISRAAESSGAKNQIETQQRVGNLVEAVQEDTLPASLLDLKVKDDKQRTRTLREMGITKFSELTEKGGQAFAGGTNERNTTILAGEIQKFFGDKFGRVTAQNDQYHHGLSYTSGHTKGNKLDFTLNGVDYSEGHKMLSKHLKEKYGMEEGKHFKIISKAHGTGPHIDFELTSLGQQTVAQAHAPKPITTATESQIPSPQSLEQSTRENSQTYLKRLEEVRQDPNRFDRLSDQEKRELQSRIDAIKENKGRGINSDVVREQPAPQSPLQQAATTTRPVVPPGSTQQASLLAPQAPQAPQVVPGKQLSQEQVDSIRRQSQPQAAAPVVTPEKAATVQQQSQPQGPATVDHAAYREQFMKFKQPEQPKEQPKTEEPPKLYAGGEVQTRGDTASVVSEDGEVLAKINPDKERISLTETGKLDVQPMYRTDPRTLEQQNDQRQQTAEVNIDEKINEATKNIMNQVRNEMPRSVNNPNWDSMMHNTVNFDSFQNESFRRAMAATRFASTGDVAKGGHFEIASANLK